LILSDQDIVREVINGNILFEPELNKEDVSPSSVDVHLGSEISVFQVLPEALTHSIDLNHPGVADALSSLLHTQTISDGGYDLMPSEFVLSRIRERLTLGPTIAARLEGRSTNARFGLTIHSTAPTVHATYSGYLTLEICNLGSMPIKLRPGLRIGQLIFERLESPPISTLRSRWQGC